MSNPNPPEATRFKPGNPGRPAGTVTWDVKFRKAVFDAAEELGRRLQDEGEKQTGIKEDRQKAMGTFLYSLMVTAAKKEPGNLLRTLANMLPKEIRADVSMRSMWGELTAMTAEMRRVTCPGSPMPDLIEAGDNGGNGGNGSHEDESNRIA